MLLTRKTDYALVALAGLARRQDGASARDLAEELNLPLPLLRNLLKLMASRGMLVSARGPAGGYKLARAPQEITLAEVVEVIEGQIHLVTCCPGGDGDPEHRCRLEDSCLIKGNVRRVHDRLMRFLDGVTLEEIAAEPGRAAVPAH